MIDNFIKSLFLHYRHENALSNITHITALTDDDFRIKFLKFFFPTIDVSKVKAIEREKPDKTDNGSRVDFYISMEDTQPYKISKPTLYMGRLIEQDKPKLFVRNLLFFLNVIAISQ